MEILLFHKLLEKYALNGQRNVSMDPFKRILNGICKIQDGIFWLVEVSLWLSY